MTRVIGKARSGLLWMIGLLCSTLAAPTVRADPQPKYGVDPSWTRPIPRPRPQPAYGVQPRPQPEPIPEPPPAPSPSPDETRTARRIGVLVERYVKAATRRPTPASRRARRAAVAELLTLGEAAPNAVERARDAATAEAVQAAGDAERAEAGGDRRAAARARARQAAAAARADALAALTTELATTFATPPPPLPPPPPPPVTPKYGVQARYGVRPR